MNRFIARPHQGELIGIGARHKTVQPVFLTCGFRHLNRRAVNCRYAGIITRLIVGETNVHAMTNVHSTRKRKFRRNFSKNLAMKNQNARENLDCLESSINDRVELKEPNTETWKSPGKSKWTFKADQTREEHFGHRSFPQGNEPSAVEIMQRFQMGKSEKRGAMDWSQPESGLIDLFHSPDDVCPRGLAAKNYVLVFLMAAIVLLTNPPILSVNGSVEITDNIANAQPLGQIRQAAVFLEKFAKGSASSKILDKVVTVISGQTAVTPDAIEGLKMAIDGEEPHDWKTDLTNNLGNFWSTTIDLVSNFNPLSWAESAGTSIQGLVEVGAERFAAFELSTLLALGERWLVWTPLVVIPMYIRMSRKRRKNEDNTDRGKKGGKKEEQKVAVKLSEEAIAKAVKVREELERIEIKANLLDLVFSLGKIAWQTSKVDQDAKRRQIDEAMDKLQKMNSFYTSLSSDLVGAATRITQNDSSLSINSTSDVDGDWSLIYVSKAVDQSQQQELPQFPSLDLFGIELNNMRQKVWHKGSRGSVPSIEEEDLADETMARNTAEIRFGPLGVFEISVQGSWENFQSGKGALVSFDTFSARPIELLGTPVREDLPALDVSIPRALQTSGEWEVVYLDNSLRINRGRTRQRYLFRKTT